MNRRDLQQLVDEIRRHAVEVGLEPFETVFEMVDAETLHEVAAFGGFPIRYPHWRFGMEFDSLSKGFAYGLQRIYELVINNDPCTAYLLRSNEAVDQKMVIAHVLGHSDFFRNNLWFAPTNRKMLDEMANHGARIRRLMDRHGFERVERFLDLVLSLDNLVDPHALYRPPARTEPAGGPGADEDEDGAREEDTVVRIPSKAYMDTFVNPPEEMRQQREDRRKERERPRKVPERPQTDVLQFLLEHAPLETWQKEILSIVRAEALYFAPQAMTKIMNEGWATFLHTKILTERILTDREVIDYADHHAGTVAMGPQSFNPYKVGLEIFRDIEDRWNRGAFGGEWEECDDYERRRRWDRRLGLGRQKVFEVRRIYNDVAFIDEFFTADFCERNRFFTFRENPRSKAPEISSRDFHRVKEALLFQLTNQGQPHLAVVDANHRNRGELYLVHEWSGADLQLAHAREALRNLHEIWGRPVHLETVESGKKKLLSCDRGEISLTEIEPSHAA